MRVATRRVVGAAVAVAGLAATVQPPVGATTKTLANKPLRWPHHLHVSGDFTVDGARGSNQRNNVCNAIACEDRTYLERHHWNGWGKVEASEREHSAVTNIACMGYETNQNWKTAHRARYIVAQGASIEITVGPIGIGVGGNGVGWSEWFGDWSASNRFDTKC